MKRILSTLAIVLLGASCAQMPVNVATPGAKPGATVEVKIIAFNDFHGNLKMPSLRVAVPDASQSTGIRFDPAGGVEQFSAIVQSLKAKNKNVVVVSAGDPNPANISTDLYGNVYWTCESAGVIVRRTTKIWKLVVF